MQRTMPDLVRRARVASPVPGGPCRNNSPCSAITSAGSRGRSSSRFSPYGVRARSPPWLLLEEPLETRCPWPPARLSCVRGRRERASSARHISPFTHIVRTFLVTEVPAVERAAAKGVGLLAPDLEHVVGRAEAWSLERLAS